MSEWKPRRFWTRARVVAAQGGHEVRLDDRPLRTPSKAPLHLPSAALATAIAEEWDAQEEVVDPTRMPLTRRANSVIDTVVPRHAEVAQAVAAYGESDLVCYRAEAPQALVERQAAAWDPLLSWAAERHGARLVTVAGVMFAPQPEPALARLGEMVAGLDAWDLAALHDLVALSGSLVIGLAALDGAHPLPALWEMSCLDERWQAEQWGEDAEAAAAQAEKAAAFLSAGRFHRLRHDLSAAER